MPNCSVLIVDGVSDSACCQKKIGDDYKYDVLTYLQLNNCSFQSMVVAQYDPDSSTHIYEINVTCPGAGGFQPVPSLPAINKDRDTNRPQDLTIIVKVYDNTNPASRILKATKSKNYDEAEGCGTGGGDKYATIIDNEGSPMILRNGISYKWAPFVALVGYDYDDRLVKSNDPDNPIHTYDIYVKPSAGISKIRSLSNLVPDLVQSDCPDELVIITRICLSGDNTVLDMKTRTLR